MIGKRGILVEELQKELWYLDKEGRATPVEESLGGLQIFHRIQDVLNGKRSDPGYGTTSAQPGDILVVEPGLTKIDFDKIDILIPERIGYTKQVILDLLGNNERPILH